MKNFFARNLDNRGRWLRAIAGGICVCGGIVSLWFNLWLAVGLVVSGVFMLVEAFRGWCLLRACGVKTRF